MKKIRYSYLYLVLMVVMLVAATAVVIGAGRTYKVKNGPVYATEIGWYSLESDNFSVDSLVGYVDKTGVNTVILPLFKNNNSVINLDGMNCIFVGDKKYSKTDFVSQLKTKLSRNKAQLYLSVDCDAFSAENAVTVLSHVAREYKPVAIILENCNYDEQLLLQIKNTVYSSNKNTQLYLQSYGFSLVQAEIFDGFILENSSLARFNDEKVNDTDKKYILHFSSPSAVSDSYILTNFHKFDGIVATQYIGDTTPDVYLQTVLQPSENLEKFGFTVSDQFAVTYPTKDFTTYYSGVFVTGTGADMPVNINGRECFVQPDGTFGVYVTLEEGENVITVSNQDKTYSYTVTKKSYKTSNVKYEKPWDETEYLPAGMVVQTTAQLTSMLSDPDDDSAIIAGLDAGTKLIVAETVQTERSGYNTYAYKLSNGGYVLASKVEITGEITHSYVADEKEDISSYSLFETSVLSSASMETLENGDQQLYITVSNSPAVVHSFSDERLSLLFLDARAENIALPQSFFYTDYTITQTDAGVVIDLVLNKNNPIWGYDIKTEAGQVVIYLKQTPHLSDSDKPLENITIMLDAGHGGKDSGALGVASGYGPLEKDLNLAVAKATKQILQQYGATVYMTREDDSFPSLDDRRNMAKDLKPDLFIAVHHNSMDYSYDSTNARGSECYYFTHQSEKLAQLLCENITAATGRQNRGAFNGYYYVTRTDIAPSVLMEYSFIINPDDYAETYSDQDIYKAAFGTAMAVLKALPQ